MLPVPRSLQIISGDAQEGTVGAALSAPIVVRLVDRNSNPIARKEVRFSVTNGNGVLAAASAVTNSDGVAQDQWTLGTSTSDSQTVQARVAVDESRGLLLLARFHATPHADVPDTVRVVSGDGQTAVAKTVTADSLLAIVVDRYGNPVPGAVVVWSVSPSGVTLSRTNDTTSAEGFTSAKVTAAGQAGDYVVVAAVGHLAANFALHVTPAPLTLNDIIGKHSLDSPRGVVEGERIVNMSGSLEILADGTGILTESWNARNCVISPSCEPFSGVNVYTRPVWLEGNVIHFGADTGTVMATEISLYGAYGLYFGERFYQRSVIPIASAIDAPAARTVEVNVDQQQPTIGTVSADPIVAARVNGRSARRSATGGDQRRMSTQRANRSHAGP